MDMDDVDDESMKINSPIESYHLPKSMVADKVPQVMKQLTQQIKH